MPTVIIDGWLLYQDSHGMASYARMLVQGLAESAWRDDLMVAIPAGSESVVPSGLRPLVLPKPVASAGILGEVLWQERLGRQMQRSHHRDVLFALSPFFSTATVPRSVVVWHDLIPLHFPRYFGRFLYRRWIFQARLRWLRRAGHVIAVSACTARELSAVLGPPLPPVTPIPHWSPLADAVIPTGEAGREIRAKYGLPSRYWLYVGGYDYRKNVELLIEAWGRASTVCDCPPLVLAGRVPADLRKPVCDVAGAMRKAGIRDDQVCRPGHIEAGDLAGVYAGAELFVYPSLLEGFGLPPLEAMSCGCPAIAADTSSLPEVVTDPAYRFPPRNPEKLTALLVAAAQQPMRLNPGFDRTYFSRDRGLREYRQVLDRVMES
jgi:glycosyltransferase involved in cell wall biosynthesis